MLFYKWWNPTTWLSDVNVSIVGGVIKALRAVFYSIATMIYKLIIDLYNLFEIMCQGRLLNSDTLIELSNRIGLILGLIMFFMVTLSFIKSLIEPDNLTDKTKGAISIVKKCILVIVMLGTSSFIFNTLYSFQKSVINNHIISKLLLPYTVDTQNFGSALSAELFISFYDVQDGLKDEVENYQDLSICQQEIYTLKDRIYDNSDFELGYSCLNESVTIIGADGNDMEITIIDFNWIVSIAVGIAVIYFLLMYCIQVGVRMVQLAVLEIISPMAIVSYLSPKPDTMFNKWTKLYFSTYIDVFLRIAIINFIIFLISTILDNSGNWTFWQSLGNPTNSYQISFITVAMILALLTFAKKAPDLIKDLFPASTSKLGLGVVTPKNFLGSLAGDDVVKRAYGAAAVGLNTIQRNTRKNLGKTWDTFHVSTASTTDKAKWIARTTVGSLYSGLGGMRRGLMTTNKSGRQTAVENAVSRTQSNQKLHDAGYGASAFGVFTAKGRQAIWNQGTDQVRGFFGKDQIIGDMVDASDAAIQGLQTRIQDAEKTYTGPTIQRSKVKNDEYTITDLNGVQRINPRTGDVYFTNAEAQAISIDGYNIAEMYGQLGKMKAKNKALTQKNEEQKSKNSK